MTSSRSSLSKQYLCIVGDSRFYVTEWNKRGAVILARQEKKKRGLDGKLEVYYDCVTNALQRQILSLSERREANND